MTGFEPGSSGIVSDRSANCATTTSQQVKLLCNSVLFVTVGYPTYGKFFACSTIVIMTLESLWLDSWVYYDSRVINKCLATAWNNVFNYLILCKQIPSKYLSSIIGRNHVGTSSKSIGEQQMTNSLMYVGNI